MARYRTQDGEMLDAICLAYYGASQGYVEGVLEANPGLAEVGPVFPANVDIELPVLPESKEADAPIRLWD